MNKGFTITPILAAITVVILTGGTVFYFYEKEISNAPRAVPGGVSDLGPSSSSDPAFYDQNYKQVSSQTLGKAEHTVVYEYKDDSNNGNYLQYLSPCGTLMTQFSEVGSVRVGRGPVYAAATNECKMVKSSYVPNDFSFRTYACENFSYTPSGSNGGHIVARATFAFQCSPESEKTKCSEARINSNSRTEDWNCSAI